MFDYGAADSLPSFDPITVNASNIKKHTIDTDTIEKCIGRTDDLNDLLYLSSSVTRTPGSGSLFQVQGESHYENGYYFKGIPLFTLSQFTGDLFADRNFIPIGLQNNLLFNRYEIAGRYSGTSGSVISVWPDMPTGKGKAGMPYPEFIGTYGTLGSDITFHLPNHKAQQYYQITFKTANMFKIKLKSYEHFGDNDAVLGRGLPASSNDIQLRISQKTTKGKFSQELYLGQERYIDFNDSSLYDFRTLNGRRGIPYNRFIAVASLEDFGPEKEWKGSIGGSHQYFFEGKQVGLYNPLITTERTNMAFFAEKTTPLFVFGSFPITLNFRSNIAKWNGTLDTRKREYYENDLFNWETYIIHDTTIRGGYCGELGISGATSYAMSQKSLLISNIRLGTFISGLKPFVNPGVSYHLKKNPVRYSIHAGVVSSQPDIRAMPDPHYAQKLINTYSTTATLESDYLYANIAIEGFYKWKNHVPVLKNRVVDPTWDPDANYRATIYGGNLAFDIALDERLLIKTSFALSKTTYYDSILSFEPDWTIPWVVKNSFKYDLLKNKMIFYILNEISEGKKIRIPEIRDHDVWSDQIVKPPVQSTTDFKLEWRQPIAKAEITVVTFDSYVLIKGIGLNIKKKNIREYYWDDNLELQSIHMPGWDFHTGIRVRYRF